MPKTLKTSHLSNQQQQELFIAMNYLNMGEIKKICQTYNIPLAGKKGDIINRIKQYITTGKISQPAVIPEISKAKKGKNYPLTANTVILYGAYRNDLKTRQFFKTLIGEHFHFTAFGQDWLNNRWQQGKPPSYQEFANMWQKEYERRKKSVAQPRAEWAYLNFLQRFQKANPKRTKTEAMVAWKKERREQATKAKEILATVLEK